MLDLPVSKWAAIMAPRRLGVPGNVGCQIIVDTSLQGRLNN
ncbi:hypothetical protein OAL43_00290 [bacterium]|nr:hypothetical protein [bacterium]